MSFYVTLLVAATIFKRNPSEYAWRKKRAAVYDALKSCRKDKIRLLDVGCNDGAELIKYSGILDGEFVGLDINSKFLNDDRFNFLVGDARYLPFRDETFDVITSTEVVEHFIDGEICVKNIYKILKKNGMFILTTPNRSRFTAFPRSLITKIRGNKIVSGPIESHLREYTQKELKNILGECGFYVKSVKFIAFNPYFPYIKISKYVYMYLDKITDKIFARFTKWDMIVVARKCRG